jgi:hypothetical protein
MAQLNKLIGKPNREMGKGQKSKIKKNKPFGMRFGFFLLLATKKIYAKQVSEFWAVKRGAFYPSHLHIKILI